MPAADPPEKPVIGVTQEQEQALDDLINGIDQKVERICKKAATRKTTGDTPTGGFSPAQLKRTRQAFQALSEEDPLLESNDGLPAAEAPTNNGAAPAPAAEAPKKKTRFFGLLSG